MSENDEEWKAKFLDLQIEFQEFQVSSQELENELESELHNVTSERDSYKRKHEKLVEQLDALRKRYDNDVVAQSRDSANKQEKINEMQVAHDALAVRVREYEQIKDDLERTVRRETHRGDGLNDQLLAVEEDYIVLKEEYDEFRTNTLTKEQRLIDQIRDYKLELKLMKSSEETASPSSLRGAEMPVSPQLAAPKFTRRSSDSVSNSLSEGEKTALRDKLLSDLSLSMDNIALGSSSTEPNLSARASRAATEATTVASSKVDKLPSSGMEVTATKDDSTLPTTSPTNRDRTPSQPLQWTFGKELKLSKNQSAPPLVIEHGRAVGAAHRPQSKSMATDNFAKKRFIFMLTAGTMFRKYRRNTVTKRFVWCSKTLSHIMWGTPGSKQVRGFVKVSKLTQISPGSPNEPLKIILSTRNQNLELEAFHTDKHRDWMAALRFLMSYRDSQIVDWNQICHDHRKLASINEMYVEQAKMLQTVTLFTRIDDQQQAHECKICFTQLMDRLQWIHNDKSQVGAVMLDDVCDVEDFIRGKPNRFVVMAAGRNLVLQCDDDQKARWVNAIRFVITYAPRLKAYTRMSSISSEDGASI